MERAGDTITPVSAVEQRHMPQSRRLRGLVGGCVALAALVSLMLAASGCGGSSGSRGGVGAHSSATAAPWMPTTTAGLPAPTPTSQERAFMTMEQQALGDLATNVQVTYDAAAQSVIVSTLVGGRVPNSQEEIAAAQERVKEICFRSEQAMWKSGTTLHEVAVNVSGPILDQYAYAINGVYGAADLTAANEAHLSWSSLTPDTAWPIYDSVFLRPTFNDVD